MSVEVAPCSITVQFQASDLGLYGEKLYEFIDKYGPLKPISEVRIFATAKQFVDFGYGINASGQVYFLFSGDSLSLKRAIKDAIAECVRVTGVIESSYDGLLLVRAKQIVAEREEEEARERAKSQENFVAQALKLPASEFVVPAKFVNGNIYPAKKIVPHDKIGDCVFWDLADSRLNDLNKEIDRLIAESDANAKAEEAAKKAADLAVEAEKAQWIEQHGSARLKRCVAEDINCQGLYETERLALDRPDFVYKDTVEWACSEPVNPPEAAFDFLDLMRKTAPDAVLKFVDYIDWRGYVVLAEYMGKKIVAGGPQAKPKHQIRR